MFVMDGATATIPAGPKARRATVPLCIDLFCGLGGWAEGFLAEGYDVIGFDIERRPYPGQLVLQDVLTLHGRQFRNAAVIVASPPCQEPSRYAMPFGGLWLEHNRMDDDGAPPIDYRGKPVLNYFRPLFDACFRIQREASEAAGRYIPLVVENVKGAQPWVGRARWHYGSFYLWGDVPALMPDTFKVKVPGFRFDGSGRSFQTASVNATGVKGKTPLNGDKPNGTGSTSWFFGARADPRDMRKNEDGEYTRFGIKQHGSGPEWFDNGLCKAGSRSEARKQASAEIAKIPFDLANHIAKVYHP